MCVESGNLGSVVVVYFFLIQNPKGNVELGIEISLNLRVRLCVRLYILYFSIYQAYFKL